MLVSLPKDTFSFFLSFLLSLYLFIYLSLERSSIHHVYLSSIYLTANVNLYISVSHVHNTKSQTFRQRTFIYLLSTVTGKKKIKKKKKVLHKRKLQTVPEPREIRLRKTGIIPSCFPSCLPI